MAHDVAEPLHTAYLSIYLLFFLEILGMYIGELILIKYLSYLIRDNSHYIILSLNHLVMFFDVVI